jgi:hypothetical protein
VGRRRVRGKLVAWAREKLQLTLEIAKRNDDTTGFVVLPRRLAWIFRCRPCLRDHERLSEHHEATVLWSMITLMGRRLARSNSRT